MYEFRLLDHATKETLGRCSDLGEAKLQRHDFQVGRGTRVDIRKILLAEPRVSETRIRVTGTLAQREKALAEAPRLDLSAERFADLSSRSDVGEEILEQALGHIHERLRSGP